MLSQQKMISSQKAWKNQGVFNCAGDLLEEPQETFKGSHLSYLVQVKYTQ